MSNRSVKIFRNSDRDKPEVHKNYVPQYQTMGIEPEEFKSAMISGVTSSKVSTEIPLTNPRAKRSAVRQPYAKVIPSPVGRGRGPVPNVGNNMEHTWSSVNGEIIDDLSEESIDDQKKMIDNNDFVTSNALGINDSSESEYSEEYIKSYMTQKDLQEVIEEKDTSSLLDVQEDEYVLLIKGILCEIGSFDF